MQLSQRLRTHFSRPFAERLEPRRLLTALPQARAEQSAALTGDGYADQVLDYHDSGAGPIAGPYGSLAGGANSNLPVPLSVVLGGEADLDNPSFLTLPTGSYVTVGFNDESIVDGSGDDFGVTEFDAADEVANVCVSSDGKSFKFIGKAYGGQTTTFDLAKINYSDPVRAVKVEGLDNNGQAPGFDLENVSVMPGSMGRGLGPLTSQLSSRPPILIVPGILGSWPTVRNFSQLFSDIRDVGSLDGIPPQELSMESPLDLDTYGPLVRSLEKARVPTKSGFVLGNLRLATTHRAAGWRERWNSRSSRR